MHPFGITTDYWLPPAEAGRRRPAEATDFRTPRPISGHPDEDTEVCDQFDADCDGHFDEGCEDTEPGPGASDAVR